MEDGIVNGGYFFFVGNDVNGVRIEVDINGFRKKAFLIVGFCGEDGEFVKVKTVFVRNSVFGEGCVDFIDFYAIFVLV